MTFDPATLSAILAMALATYLTRVGGLWLAGRIPSSGRVRAALDALPIAVLVAVIAPSATAGPAEIVAALVAILAVRRLPLLAVVVLAVACVVALRALGG
ncbi:AzlD family protein [Methylobrevis pamukkalensis]|uniref:Branched-chain amino acid transport protein (AzlD) n=1 Tax=Methylobrevis pamukkalensis TaxID=1439726 RepID=A0A1E3H535_9HYPH|nr:AzlD domain-containing protein [Methylobrevis pamukkalensis]ODN71443.1 Branched-chain amino acid transport protein (AzlD) [Methylobrevis pamukkalensis]